MFVTRRFFEPFTLDAMAGELTTASATGDLRFGIWEQTSTGRVGDLVVDAGTDVATSTGIRQATMGSSVTIPPGRYFAAMIPQGVTSTNPEFRMADALPQMAPVATPPSGGNDAALYWRASDGDAITGALGDNPTAAIPAGAPPRVPLIWLRRAA